MLNSECLEVFNKYLVEVKKCSTNTLSSYMRDVRQFGDYMQTHTTEDIVSATEDELSEYIDWLKGNGKSVATVSRAIASLKCMYGVLCEDGYVSENPTVKLAPEKSQHKLPQILTSKEVDLLLEQPSCTDAKGYRDRAMLELLYATGIRVSELIALNISDVNTSAGVVRCAPNTEKERLIPLYLTAVKALNEYIEFVRPQMIALPTEQALFVNVSGERMSRQGFWKIIKYYQKKANIDKDITPHTLRHSFAAHLLENGADIHAIQEMLGHSSINVTEIYTHVALSKQKDILQNKHPRQRFEL
mgnify:CR=1 FL=1